MHYLPEKNELKEKITIREQIARELYDEYIEAIVTGNTVYTLEVESDLTYITNEIKSLKKQIEPDQY